MEKKKRGGFTLLELLAVVAILAVFVSAAAVSIVSGTASAKVGSGVRGVVQMTRYARTMALLKQRPVNVVFHSDGTIEAIAETSNDGFSKSEADEIGSPAAPVSDPPGSLKEGALQAETVSSRGSAEDGGEVGEEGEDAQRSGAADKFSSEQDVKKFDGVTFTVEILDETGAVIDPADAESLGRSVKTGEREPDGDAGGDPVATTSIRYDTTGRCPPFRVIVRRADAPDSPGRTVSVDRFGRTRADAEDPR